MNARIAERNDKLAQKQNLLIEMDPAIAAAFDRSVNISTANGNAAHLLKVGAKRRRTQAQINIDKAEEKSFREKMEDHKITVSNLKIQLAVVEEEMNSNKNAALILEDLIEKGILRKNPDGTVDPVDGPNVIGNSEDVIRASWSCDQLC